MFIIILIIAISIFFIFFNKSTSKYLKTGNNMSSQEIVENFLNISSYTANVTVEVTSNKNQNKYVLNQKYIDPNHIEQEVLEPSNIVGTKIIKDESGVRVENTNLSLSKIFENYNSISDNCLDLNSFIEDYKQVDTSSFEETETEIIMKTTSSNDNKYTKHKTLHIDSSTCKPTKLEIKDNNQNTKIVILYNEVEINI